METIDGNQSLAAQESAIRAEEAAGTELLGLLPLMNGPKNNGASFRDLNPGQRPSTIGLAIGLPPTGKTLVCFATIYVNGQLATISAFR